MFQKLFSEKINVEGWIFYIILDKTLLYRGDSLQYIGEKKIGDIEYFSDEMTSKNYGLVSFYQSSKLLKLLALDELNNLERLYSQARENVRDSITKSFGYSIDHKQIKRHRDYDNDYIIAQYICNQGLDGFAHEEIKSKSETNFHSEVILCEPLSKLELAGHLDYSEKEKEQLVSIHRLHNYARDENNKKVNVKATNIFSDDSSSSSDEEKNEINKPHLFYL